MAIGEVAGNMGFLYIVQSTKNRQFYIGSTPDYKKRLIEHNQDLCKATKGRGPWRMVFVQKFETLKQARQAEYKLKSKKSRQIIELIIKDQEIKFLRE